MPFGLPIAPYVMKQMACDAVSILLSGLRSAFSDSLGIQAALVQNIDDRVTFETDHDRAVA